MTTGERRWGDMRRFHTHCLHQTFPWCLSRCRCWEYKNPPIPWPTQTHRQESQIRCISHISPEKCVIQAGQLFSIVKSHKLHKLLTGWLTFPHMSDVLWSHSPPLPAPSASSSPSHQSFSFAFLFLKFSCHVWEKTLSICLSFWTWFISLNAVTRGWGRTVVWGPDFEMGQTWIWATFQGTYTSCLSSLFVKQDQSS